MLICESMSNQKIFNETEIHSNIPSLNLFFLSIFKGLQVRENIELTVFTTFHSKLS